MIPLSLKEDKEQLKQEQLQEEADNSLFAQDEDELYDDTPETFEPPQLNPELDDWEIEEALKIIAMLGKGKQLYSLLLVTGDVGSGKDLFCNTYAWKIKRYFDRTIFRDEKPRELFGFYKPFNEFYLLNWVAQTRAVNKEVRKWSLTAMFDLWWKTIGEASLHNSCLYLTEFHDWMYNRASMHPKDKLLGRIIKRRRHVNTVMFGTTPKYNELDWKNCLQYCDKLVRCKKDAKHSEVHHYTIQPVKFDLMKFRLIPDGNPSYTKIDGIRPRAHLNGKNYFNLYNSKSRTAK
jgi:hypothetical protein